MKKLRVLARTLVIDANKILLVRNKNANFWYPPGGGWEYETETITECAIREVLEETGYIVNIEKLLWLQEFHEGEKTFFETFWLSKISDSNTQTDELMAQHIDQDPDGAVEEARWYTQDELKELKVFPERIKSYATLIEEQTHITNPFIGIFL
jgi:ADP-ribose pyrophosphatase YjhB (NUDIX family)